ncbi:MAG: aminotransferase class V-fold PLP-dependent enzyme, partial [Deltaproteobacteria bacterium]|nr:aminotransferase class V-fold PLP-dependent enzyme [Deltaproteobacteria bacterium]
MQAFSEKEIKEYRYLFPVSKHWTYLNHASVAPISRRVADAIYLVSQESLHQGYTLWESWIENIEKTRQSVAQLIKAQSQEIAFIKNTSHGLSLIAQGLDWQKGDEIIISESEFPSNVYPWMALAEKGVVLKKIPNRAGELAMEELEPLITKKTKLVSLSSVQYATGYRLELEKLGAHLKEKNILFCVDAIQSLGLFPIDVQAANIDFLAADAHKWLLGPEGIGV